MDFYVTVTGPVIRLLSLLGVPSFAAVVFGGFILPALLVPVAAGAAWAAVAVAERRGVRIVRNVALFLLVAFIVAGARIAWGGGAGVLLAYVGIAMMMIALARFIAARVLHFYDSRAAARGVRDISD